MGLFLHQTTTLISHNANILSCLWVFSYIKPQQLVCNLYPFLVVYGSFPASNHNYVVVVLAAELVVYGSFPTSNHNVGSKTIAAVKLFMGLFLHQTTTRGGLLIMTTSCLWVFSYIKPQHGHTVDCYHGVVYGSFPTSNHNHFDTRNFIVPLFMGLFLHQTTTHRRVNIRLSGLFMGLFLHQTTTSKGILRTATQLFMGLFLHQTTT